MDNKIVDQVVASPDVPEPKPVDPLEVIDKKVQSVEVQEKPGVDTLDKVGSDFD